LIGFEDFSQKIIQMGLGDLIYKKPNMYKPTNTAQKNETTDLKDINWWFLD
jgi:hypothetical protein